VRARTAGSPFARAFFVMAEGMGIIGDTPPPQHATQGHAQIRVDGQPDAREGRWQAPGRATPGSADVSVHEHDGPRGSAAGASG
jgi:hypothetical protein